MKYIKLFLNHQDYESYITGSTAVLPNVSLCDSENEVHYNKKGDEPVIPTNVIMYYAPSKLTETTSQKTAGLHTNAFNTTISSHDFEDGVGTITFADDVTTVGSYAFYSASTVTKVEIPNSVTSIGANAFEYCSGSTSINIPTGVTSIGNYAFSNCIGLTSVNIPTGVTSIANYAFLNCRNLTSITIPSGVTSIETNAFSNCSSLTSITLGSGVTSIGTSAFNGCKSLTSIKVDSNNTVYDSRNNCNAIIETSTNTLIQGCNNSIIPNSVTRIGESAFNGRSSLSSISIPDSVTSIGANAFYNCIGLTSVNIPTGVTSIANYAFYRCAGLTSITIPSGVTSISSYAFEDCSGLTSVTIYAIAPPSLGTGTFDNNASGRKFYVPSESVNTYKSSEYWSGYASDILPIT